MEKEIAALLVDDEPGCIDMLRRYLGMHCPRIKIIDTANTAAQAVQLLNTRPIDLAFLDVHLFDTNIFDSIPELGENNIKKVFVTAYEQYALKALRVSALDYLLKPLETSEIIRCYGKIRECFDERPDLKNPETIPVGQRSAMITLRQGDNIYVIRQDDIILLKANGIYTNVFFEYHGKLKTVLISRPISIVYQQWDGLELMRVHRSYAVNTKKLTGIKKQGAGLNLELAGLGPVPVAKRRIAYFLEQYNQ
jgi:two-component system LytT family response regulator